MYIFYICYTQKFTLKKKKATPQDFRFLRRGEDMIMERRKWISCATGHGGLTVPSANCIYEAHTQGQPLFSSNVILLLMAQM